MAEAAAHFWPGWVVIEARECRLLKGIELKEKNQKLTVKFNPPQYGSSDGFEVNADISSGYTNGNHRIHYRSILRFEQQVPDGFKHKPPAYTRKKVAVTKAYNEWLFHGPRFQVFEKIYGLSEEGAKALLKTTSPAQWMKNVGPKHSQWIFDPAVVDAAAQMAILWTRSFCNQTALPTCFGRVVRYSKSLPEQLYMNFEHIISNIPNSIRANVYFSDTEHNILLLIENMECVSSSALNRLGGTAKIYESYLPRLSSKEKF